MNLAQGENIFTVRRLFVHYYAALHKYIPNWSGHGRHYGWVWLLSFGIFCVDADSMPPYRQDRILYKLLDAFRIIYK